MQTNRLTLLWILKTVVVRLLLNSPGLDISSLVAISGTRLKANKTYSLEMGYWGDANLLYIWPHLTKVWIFEKVISSRMNLWLVEVKKSVSPMFWLQENLDFGWKKLTTDQRFILKWITSLKIHTLVMLLKLNEIIYVVHLGHSSFYFSIAPYCNQ